MRTLILNSDLKRLYVGAAAAAVLGLLGGAIMYPNLRAGEDAEGAQLIAGVSGVRSEDLTPTASWTSYTGRVPDYVIGTDYTRLPAAYADASYADDASASDLMAYEAPSDEAEPASAYAAEEHAAMAVHVGLSAEEAAREPPRYPSVSGGVPNGADLPPPPEPPIEPALVVTG